MRKLKTFFLGLAITLGISAAVYLQAHLELLGIPPAYAGLAGGALAALIIALKQEQQNV